MKYNVSENQEIDFGDMDPSFFLVGLLNAFINQFQAVGDRLCREISWKQAFLLVCIQYFSQAPTLGELSEMVGCSHQNVKQMLLKLREMGFVQFTPDKTDKRKQRILLTEKAKEFSAKNDKPSEEFMSQMFASVGKEELEITIRTIRKLDDQLKKMK